MPFYHQKKIIAQIIIYNIAQQWFGNISKLESSEDICLNKGFSYLISIECLSHNKILLQNKDNFILNCFIDIMIGDTKDLELTSEKLFSSTYCLI